MTNEQLRHSIRIGKGLMPAFGGLMADEDIADVIAFIRTLVPPGTAPAPQAPGAAAPQAPAAPQAAPGAAALQVAPGAAALAPSADVAAGVVVR